MVKDSCGLTASKNRGVCSEPMMTMCNIASPFQTTNTDDRVSESNCSVYTNIVKHLMQQMEALVYLVYLLQMMINMTRRVVEFLTSFFVFLNNVHNLTSSSVWLIYLSPKFAFVVVTPIFFFALKIVFIWSKINKHDIYLKKPLSYLKNEVFQPFNGIKAMPDF